MAGQIAENLDALLEFFVRGDIADAEMGVLLTEDIAGDDEDIVFNGFFDKLGRIGVLLRCLDEHIIFERLKNTINSLNIILCTFYSQFYFLFSLYL